MNNPGLSSPTIQLSSEEIETLFSIHQLLANEMDNEVLLNELVKLTRTVFIFDSVTIYRKIDEQMEAYFARIIGRGSSTPFDLAWGEKVAQIVIGFGNPYLQETTPRKEVNRLEQCYYLGLPMYVDGQIEGAIVFIRFGGPIYQTREMDLAKLIALSFTQVLTREKIIENFGETEASRRYRQLQDDFIAAVSHDINTPIGFIKGYTTTLLRDDTEWEWETVRDFLEIIDEETDHLSELIDNLLDSSRLQSGTLFVNLEKMDITAFSDHIAHRLETRYPNLDIHLDVPKTELRIMGAPKRITQVIDNLISNASKYAPGSNIYISFDNDENNVYIKVADDGPGIAKDHLDHLFERFYRVPEKSSGIRGSGLGLFICERIIRMHDGEISVDSKIGRGTTFIIRLPIEKDSGG
ncbi:MAG: HAMP domain-containing histidine kinase [Anaerolineales bacterium]|nr:HAMP domain-containing histidine kinase [Anaerolineales bacterium]